MSDMWLPLVWYAGSWAPHLRSVSHPLSLHVDKRKPSKGFLLPAAFTLARAWGTVPSNNPRTASMDIYRAGKGIA